MQIKIITAYSYTHFNNEQDTKSQSAMDCTGSHKLSTSIKKREFFASL